MLTGLVKSQVPSKPSTYSYIAQFVNDNGFSNIILYFYGERGSLFFSHWATRNSGLALFVSVVPAPIPKHLLQTYFLIDMARREQLPSVVGSCSDQRGDGTCWAIHYCYLYIHR